MNERNIFELAEEGRALLPEKQGLLPSEILKLMFYAGLAGSRLTDQIIEMLKAAFYAGAALGSKEKQHNMKGVIEG